jgi:DNA primase
MTLILKKKTESFDLTTIKQALKDNVNAVVAFLGLKLDRNGSLLMGCCPIHGGDNPTAFHIQTDGPYRGKIHCYTSDCNKGGTDLLSLIMRVRKISFPEALKVSADIIGDRISFTSPAPSFFIRKPNDIDPSPAVPLVGKASRVSVRNLLEIPSRYYLTERNFDGKILDDYDVGDCWVVGNRMRGRTVFPVYDFDYKCVGAVGRKISSTWQTTKWKNSKGFQASRTFYGLWNYNKTGRAIVVEGQGDLLRLRQAGYSDSLGMFKKELSEDQIRLLRDMGVKDLLVITDSDSAGNEGYESIKQKTEGLFNVSRYVTKTKDIGAMDVMSVRNLCL